jgi:ribosomal protein S18 acetylase RimI-like enzyme
LIRLFESKDFDELVNLQEMCYNEDDPNMIRSLSKALTRAPSWVVDESGIRSALISDIVNHAPYIWSLATNPSHRGQGLAKSLLVEFEKHYKDAGYTNAWLHTRVENPAQKLYFDAGYRIASFEPNVYGPRQHGITMRKRFV